MTDKPEITRNDIAAITVLKKVMDRLDADRAAYEARVETAQASLNTFNQLLSLASNGSHTHTHSLGFTIPPWEPYLMQAEYDTLRAWADGEDVLLHVLGADR